MSRSVRPALAVILCLALAAAFAAEAKPLVVDEEVPAARGFALETVAEGLERPWAMDWLPDGSMLITERPGRVRLLQNGQLNPRPLEGVPQVFARGQGGMLDVAVHPGFAENRLVYFTYAHGTDKANRTRLARAKFSNGGFTDWQVIFQVGQAKSNAQHFGSRLVWLPDGTLLVAIGDGGNPPVRLEGAFIRQQAQNLKSHLGKVLRLNQDGSIPRDNPFAGKPQAAPAVWSFGHRNIQGMVRDPLRGRIWATEHGALGGDELNLVQPRNNYGWPRATHSREYSGPIISPHTSLPGFVDPLLVWQTAIAPSGLEVLTSDVYPGWRGDLFAGGLKTQDIRRIRLDKAGTILGQEALRVGQRVRDVRQGPDGHLYVLTDEKNGQLLRIVPTPAEEFPRAP